MRNDKPCGLCTGVVTVSAVGRLGLVMLASTRLGLVIVVLAFFEGDASIAQVAGVELSTESSPIFFSILLSNMSNLWLDTSCHKK